MRVADTSFCRWSSTHLQVDESQASIGKRYARTDEIGVPFAITVDDQTATDSQVTVRERDTAAQIRVPVANVPQLVRAHTRGLAWVG